MPKIYRVICYDGPDEWLAKQLDASIHGLRQMGAGSIAVATIDPEDGLSIKIARDKLFTSVATIAPIS